MGKIAMALYLNAFAGLNLGGNLTEMRWDQRHASADQANNKRKRKSVLKRNISLGVSQQAAMKRGDGFIRSRRLRRKYPARTTTPNTINATRSNLFFKKHSCIKVLNLISLNHSGAITWEFPKQRRWEDKPAHDLQHCCKLANGASLRVGAHRPRRAAAGCQAAPNSLHSP